MNTKPYVGITGPVTIKESKDISREFYSAGYSMNRNHLPMLGFLVSYKTLNKVHTDNRRYPLFEKIPELLEEVKGKVFSTIHYNSKKVDTLYEQVSEIFNYKNIYKNELCRGIQLNIPFPPIKELEKIKNEFSNLKIIFQANHKVLDYGTPKEVAEKLKEYDNLIDYILLDPSGGKGEEFDVNKSIIFYEEINKILPEVTIGFAGGLTGENVANRINQISDKLGHKKFCIDAEGGLRDKLSQEYGDDLLNIEKIRSYLQESKIILK